MLCKEYIDTFSDLPCPIYDKTDCEDDQLVTSCSIISYDSSPNCIRYMCNRSNVASSTEMFQDVLSEPETIVSPEVDIGHNSTIPEVSY